MEKKYTNYPLDEVNQKPWPLVERMQAVFQELDISEGHIDESVERIKSEFVKANLFFSPLPDSELLLIGGGSGTAVVGRSLYQEGVSDFSMLANTGEVNKNITTGKAQGAGMIFEEIPTSMDCIDILKQSLHSTPEMERSRIHQLLDSKRPPNMRFGYLAFEALRQIFNDPQLAADYLNRWMENPYRVIPSTGDRTELYFNMAGRMLSLNDYGNRQDTTQIADSFDLIPRPTISSHATEAIKKARTVIVGPGDLHFSVLPHWRITGFHEQIAKAAQNIQFVVVANLTARDKDIPNFTLSDLLELYSKYLPKTDNMIALVNNEEIEGASPLIDDIAGDLYHGFTILRRGLASQTINANNQPVHDEHRLGIALREIIQR